ncbi:hypothetical protein CYMTET_44484 [Cymbomonas tetramitiformis]|uniref:Fatty acid hydroxylase domain-containing protein n=1 Tax=Cymbomonas tetramitiformis TaxID=36881 RepID=A0AAE0C049_9CHLO|nr:hypothetical protein CYMTET_44484 [Cymbomonas tetramitiformis]
MYTYVAGCHLGHQLEFGVALLCYLFFFPIDEAKILHPKWILQVIGFNLTCEFVICGFWHWFMYRSSYGQSAPMQVKKFNAVNQYEEEKAHGFFTSFGNLQREVLFTTMGWLQSAALQCFAMHMWASGRIPFYMDFWGPAGENAFRSMSHLLFITYWREFHFYWCHRMIHPWRVQLPLLGDPGLFLYKKFHSLHHKSYNPGPFSGLAMHPVEHFFYYSCAWLPLCFNTHPLHFLYAKFHADIAPIGGHDGYGDPAGNGDFHYLHHAKFECNYGVPLIPFDKLFGTWIDYAQSKPAKKL